MARRRRGGGSRGGWAPYVPVARRRKKAERFAAAAARDGRPLQPVTSSSRTIADTFWGRAWCRNLEAYGDFSNRLPRGRRYLRNGSVIDLQLERGRASAWVSGSRPYEVTVEIDPLPDDRWAVVRAACAGRIESLVDLLTGELSEAAMQVLTAQDEGIFPAPGELRLGCSCPDWATVCKHVAAVLYGIGVRFDADPTLFFTLRGVDHQDLIASVADSGLGATSAPADGAAHVADDDIAGIFGIELDDAPPVDRDETAGASRSRRGKEPAAQPAPGRRRRAASAGKRKGAAKREPARHGVRSSQAPESREATRDEPGASDVLTAAELTAAGVPRSTITSWLKRGVLARTATRGRYLMTEETGPALEAYFEHRP